MPIPSPTEVKPWYLRNITEALYLDEPSGNVVVRTGFTGDIVISGNVVIPGTVTIDSSPENPVHVHINEIGTSGILTVPYMPVSGNVVVDSGNVVIDSGNVTVNGSVSITSLPEVEIKNDTGNPIPISANTTVNSSSNPVYVNSTGSAVTLGTGSTDAFGRLRVSEPFTLFDSKARYYDHNDFSSSTSTGGAVVYNADSSTFALNVTTASGSSVIRETKRVFPYQPGKSLLTLATFAMNTPKQNLRQRVGYFTTNNGIYLENDGVYNYLVIRSYSTGVLVEDRVRQDAWDNPFAALNVDRTQIFWTDVEWLGVGSVRCGFVVNGEYVLCHTFHHANILNNTTTYMTTATLPVRYEITNTAGTASASTMRQICSTVISEGGYNSFNYTETAGLGLSVLRLATAGTYYPVVSIRLASSRLDSIVLPRQVDILSPTVNYYRWKLVMNPTLGGATWASTSSTGSVQIDTAATTVSGGTELQAGYVSSRELSQLGANEFSFQLGRTLAGVSDVVTLVISATSNNADVLAQIGWQEIT